MDAEPLVLVERLSQSAEATEDFGAQLGRRVGPGTVIALGGDLGAGKTCLVRGLARGLGLAEGVSSPTYTLMQAHEGGRLTLYHFDAWMEGREEALFQDGGDEWLRGDGVCVVEWAGRVEEWLPRPYLAIELGHRAPEQRSLRILLAAEDGSEHESEAARGLRELVEGLEFGPDLPPLDRDPERASIRDRKG